MEKVELTRAEAPEAFGELNDALFTLKKLYDKGMRRIEAQGKDGKLYIFEVTVAE